MGIKIITTNVKIDECDYENFRILMLKRRKKVGAAIGELIVKELRENEEKRNESSDASLSIKSSVTLTDTTVERWPA